MGPAELERHYLRWGGSPKRGRNLLGQYGQGGKAAVGHLGTSFTVEASRPGDKVAWRFADPNYRDRTKLKTYELKEVAKRVALEQGYVRIRIDGVDKRIEGLMNCAICRRVAGVRAFARVPAAASPGNASSRSASLTKRAVDIWYQLETAAREVFKSLEGASVGVFERRVNEVILLAFQLRARRRDARSRKPAVQLPLIS